MSFNKTVFVIFICSLAIVGCKNKNSNIQKNSQEDYTAKKMLQGIWINEDEEDVDFRAMGDTIYYPDSTSQPVYFQIFNDTLVLHGANNVKYPIVKQAPHLFIFKNQNGELVKLTLSEDPSDKYMFEDSRPQALNQNVVIKRDTVLIHANERYHSYVQVNPTTYKVMKASYNDEGVEVDNVYYDNIIHISLFKGALKLFSRDFHKQDFTGKVPTEFLRQSILSDMIFNKMDSDGFHYTASICIPDSPSSYMVDVIISYSGTLKLRIN